MTFFKIESWDDRHSLKLLRSVSEMTVVHFLFAFFWQKEKCDTKILFCYRLFQTQHFLQRCQKDRCKQSPFRLKSYNKVKIIFMIVVHTFFFREMTFLAHPNLVACIYLMNRKDRRKILLSTGNRIEMHRKNNQNME